MWSQDFRFRGNAIPQTLGFPRGERGEKNSRPTWISLYPRDDAGLRGDRFGGEWYIDGGFGGIKIKDAASTSLVADLGAGYSYAFSRKGTWIGVAPPERGAWTVHVWPWGLNLLTDRACRLLPRNLTREEWTRFDLTKLGFGASRATCENLPFPDKTAN